MKKNILVDGVAQTVEMTEAEIAELQVAVSPEVQIEQLKVELARYDYIGVKLAMGVATREEYAAEIAHTELLRQQIRVLEGEAEYDTYLTAEATKMPEEI